MKIALPLANCPFLDQCTRLPALTVIHMLSLDDIAGHEKLGRLKFTLPNDGPLYSVMGHFLQSPRILLTQSPMRLNKLLV